MGDRLVKLSYREIIKDELYRIKITMPEEGFEEDVKGTLVDYVNNDNKLRFKGGVKVNKGEILALLLSSYTKYSFRTMGTNSVVDKLESKLDKAFRKAAGLENG
jgi:hypothetical protein